MFRALAILFAVLSVFILPLIVGVPTGALFQLGLPLIFICSCFAGFLLAWPFEVLLAAFKDGLDSFSERESLPQDLAEEILRISAIARKEGILQVEAQRNTIRDEGFKQAVKLVIDGMRVEQLQEFLKVDLSGGGPQNSLRVMQHGSNVVWLSAFLSTLLGISRSLGSPNNLSKSLSADVLPLVLAGALSLFFFMPAVKRLEKRSQDRLIRKRMIQQGTLGIAEGLAPTALEERLQSLMGNA